MSSCETTTVRGLERKHLHKLLCFALKENHFLFENKLFDQVDGVAMGSPLGPIIANIFMSNLESKPLMSYQGVKPSYYRRYVDDTFLVFESRSDVLPFFDWFNQQHVNIKFTFHNDVSIFTEDAQDHQDEESLTSNVIQQQPHTSPIEWGNSHIQRDTSPLQSSPPLTLPTTAHTMTTSVVPGGLTSRIPPPPSASPHLHIVVFNTQHV